MINLHGSGSQNPWSCNDWKGYSPEDQCFLSLSPENSNSLCHNCPTHSSHKCPTHLPFNCPTHLTHKCHTIIPLCLMSRYVARALAQGRQNGSSRPSNHWINIFTNLDRPNSRHLDCTGQVCVWECYSLVSRLPTY